MSQLPVVAALVAMAVGSIAFCGWLLDISALKSVIRGAVEMKANTAVGLFAAGAGLILQRVPGSAGRTIALALAVFVAVLGIATGTQYLSGADFGIDELLFRDTAQAYNLIPGRMSPFSAATFTATGLALAALHHPALRPLATALAVVVGMVGGLSLLGYLWNVGELVTDRVLPPVALNTAVAFVALGAGIGAAARRAGPAAEPAALFAGRVERRVAAGFVAAFAFLILGGAVTYRSSAAYVDAAESRSRNLEDRALLGQLYGTLSDAQVTGRLYLRSRDPQALARFRQLAGEARDAARKLGRAAETTPAVAPRAAELTRLAEMRLTEVERAFALPSAEHAAAADRLLAAAGRNADEFLVLLHDIDTSEAESAAERAAAAAAASIRALGLLVGTLAGAALAFVLLLHGVRREIAGRARAEAGLHELNAELESRIEQRTAELQRSRAQLAELFELAPDAMLIADHDGSVVEVNRRAETLFGAGRHALVGQPVASLFAGDAARAADALLSPPPPGAPRREAIALRGRSADGREFPLEASASPLANGRRAQVLAALRDTSERQAMLDAIGRSEALYRQTLDHLLEGCQVIDREWRFVYVNAVAARQGRRDPQELIGRRITDCFPGIEQTAVFASMQRCMTGRAAEISELEYLQADGAREWFEVACLPIREGILVFSIDVTVRRRAADALRDVNAELERRVAERTAELVQAREAAEAANRSKSAFLATMSHEIRTPMNGVVGMVEVLAQSGLSERQADAAATIRMSAFALLALIDDILDFSKIEAGRLDLERAPFALADLVEGVCETLASLAVDKDVDLDLFVSPRLPVRVVADATRLRQVLFNLVGNAVKFSAGLGRRGRVAVRAEPDLVQPGTIVFSVADNGIGMGPETVAQLFTPFRQAEASTTRRFGGTGLGLAICRRLVDLMGGRIEVQSAPGAGSTFRVHVHLAADPTGGAWVPPDLGGVDCRIVGRPRIADDLRAYLERAGATVTDAAAGDGPPAAAEPGQVVAVHVSRRDGTLGDPSAAFIATDGHLRHVLVVRGRRGPAPPPGDHLVLVDGTCLRRGALVRAVAVAAGRASPEQLAGDPGDLRDGLPARAPSVAEARAQGRLILVAEDDAINQKVILRQIEMLGLAAEVAENGAEALRLWHGGRYAVVLTDLHMPDLDGYGLAQAIRDAEAARGRRERVPILALTANALRGEALRAQAAGMDEYLTKPLRLAELRAALARWLPPDGAADTEPSPMDDGGRVGVPANFDPQALVALVGNDAAVVDELLERFISSARDAAAELRAGGADARALGAVAHRLKSTARAVGATALGDACAELENACRLGAVAGIGARVERLLAEVAASDAAIRAHLAGRWVTRPDTAEERCAH